MYANPLILSLFISAGVKPSAVQTWAENPEVRPWFNRLAGRDAVVAYLPPRVSHGDATWAVASWLGGGSQRLRWQLAWRRSEEFVACAPYHGHAYWRVVSDDMDPNLVLTVALVEGMLIGCLSDREEAMIELLDALDGLRPSMAARMKQAVFTPAHMPDGVFDAIWIETEDVVGRRRSPRYPVGAEFREISRTALVCRAYFADVFAPKSLDAGCLDDMARVLGDAPVWAAGFPLSWVADDSASARSAWQGTLRRLAQAQEAESVVVALLDRKYAGRIAGMRVPAVIAALPLKHPERAEEQIRAAMDEWNARSKWGLIPYPWAQVNGTSIVVIEGTGQNMYAFLDPEEKPAYAIIGSWLYAAVQAGGLKQVLEQEGEAGGDACWSRAVARTAPFWLWGDFRLGNDVLRLALSAYAFRLVLEDAGGTQQKRQRLNEWKAWLDAFEPLEQCAIRAEPWNGNGLALDINMGSFCR